MGTFVGGGFWYMGFFYLLGKLSLNSRVFFEGWIRRFFVVEIVYFFYR